MINTQPTQEPPQREEDELRAEYDTETLRAMLKNGVRGKYAGRLTRQAVLAPDVAKAFPTDKEVNDALRSLMAQEKPHLVEAA